VLLSCTEMCRPLHRSISASNGDYRSIGKSTWGLAIGPINARTFSDLPQVDGDSNRLLIFLPLAIPIYSFKPASAIQIFCVFFPSISRSSCLWGLTACIAGVVGVIKKIYQGAGRVKAISVHCLSMLLAASTLT
jgi:hypothetical protein